MFEKTIARVEARLKGMVFDCHACGQCVFRQTGLICPMSCPSPVAAAELVKLGIQAVCQSTCRDHDTKTSFVAELLKNQLNSVNPTGTQSPP